jgi:hypothetical protein
VTSEEGEITTPVPQLSPVSPATRYKAGVSTPITASKLSATAPDGPEVVTTPISALNTLAPDGPEAITPNSSTFHITPEPTGLPATLKTEEGPDSVGVITIEGPEEDLVDDE